MARSGDGLRFTVNVFVLDFLALRNIEALRKRKDEIVNAEGITRERKDRFENAANTYDRAFYIIASSGISGLAFSVLFRHYAPPLRQITGCRCFRRGTVTAR